MLRGGIGSAGGMGSAEGVGSAGGGWGERGAFLGGCPFFSPKIKDMKSYRHEQNIIDKEVGPTVTNR